MQLNIMRKTSTAQTETVGKIEQGYCTINSWRNTTKSAFSVETESVKETWSCLLYQPKKRLSHRRKMTLKSTNQTLEKKTIHSKVMMYCLLGASWHFLFFFFHTGSSISLVKNNTSPVIQRHICRKSGQYSYLYMASLHGGVIYCTFWVFFTLNKTYQNHCARHS